MERIMDGYLRLVREDRDRLILDRHYIGTPERTDALLDELEAIRSQIARTGRWRHPFRRMRLERDLWDYTAELRHNERVRLRRAA